MRTAWVNPGDRAVGPVGHPDAARASCDAGRRGADGHAGRNMAGAQIERAGAIRGDHARRAGPPTSEHHRGGYRRREQQRRGSERGAAPAPPGARYRPSGWRRPRLGGQIEGWIVRQHRGLQALQLRAGLKPQLLNQ